MKRQSRKLALHRETLVQLEAQHLAGGRPVTGITCPAICDWVSELYTACDCPATLLACA